MGASSCVSCGECVAACPTGALTNKPIHDIPIRPRTELDAVDTVCPYCGVGCALTYYVDRERGAIAYAEGREQPGSHGRLCVKGRYGWDYAASPQRLTVPLIRREDSYPKGALSADVRGDMNASDVVVSAEANSHGLTDGDSPKEKRKGGKRGRKPGGLVDYAEVLPHFREATWEEALDLVARRLSEIYLAQRPARDRRLRLRQVLQRGGLPLPEADQDRLPHQQRGPLHPALPRLQRVGAVRGDRLGRGLHHLRRRDQRRGRDRHRQQLDRQPPGRVQLLQAGAAQRHDDHLHRPAGRQDGRPRGHLLPAQAGHRRRLLQRRHARGHPARADRRGLHRDPDLQLRGARADRRRLPAGAGRADHRRARRPDPPGRAGLGRGPLRASSSGAWGSPSTPPAPTTPAA